MTATTTATRTAGNAGVSSPSRTTRSTVFPTLSALTTHLAEKMELALEEDVAPVDPEQDRLAQVAESIAGLSESEMEELILKKLERKAADL